MKAKTRNTLNTIFSASSFISLTLSVLMIVGIVPNKLEVQSPSMSFVGGTSSVVNFLIPVFIISLLFSVYYILKYMRWIK